MEAVIEMEGRGSGAVSSGGGVTVVSSDAPSDYHVAPAAPRPAENQTQLPGSTAKPPPPSLDLPVKKKRGRPRKYAPDGSLAAPFSPKPISSSAPPPVIDFSAPKRGKVKAIGSLSKPSFEVENLGDWVGCSVGTNFTPHIISVNAGEDVTMKVISFSQQGPRALCILSANGIISSVTLRQADSSGGTLTYEGRFEILSLSGSFMPNDIGGTRSRSGGMSVSLASPDGRVVGGGVAGLLVAASPVQVVVGSFLTGNQHEPKPKKQKLDISPAFITTSAVPISTAEPNKSISSTTPTYRADNWCALPSDARNKPTDINVSMP